MKNQAPKYITRREIRIGMGSRKSRRYGIKSKGGRRPRAVLAERIQGLRVDGWVVR